MDSNTTPEAATSTYERGFLEVVTHDPERGTYRIHGNVRTVTVHPGHPLHTYIANGLDIHDMTPPQATHDPEHDDGTPDPS